MSAKKSKPAAREERRANRRRNDEPLMRLAAMETDRKAPTKARNEPVRPLNDAQRRYDAAMRSSDIVFGIGPAGTGKTWLATMRAAEAFKDERIQKIYLTRPAVEAAGESLGFLPGEIEEKYAPYIQPLREALEEAFGSSHLEYLLKNKKIEPVPLAFMRGRTLKNCWVIADEMQNANLEQMKMLLSRIGEGAKFIINGDPDQTDLGAGSGLVKAVQKVRRIDEVSVVEFSEDDIVRSGLCQKIVEAFSSKPVNSRYNAVNDQNDEGLRRYLDEPIA